MPMGAALAAERLYERGKFVRVQHSDPAEFRARAREHLAILVRGYPKWERMGDQSRRGFVSGGCIIKDGLPMVYGKRRRIYRAYLHEDGIGLSVLITLEFTTEQRSGKRKVSLSGMSVTNNCIGPIPYW